MPVYVKELVRLVKTLTYKQKISAKQDESMVDKLLGRFDDKSEKTTSTSILKDLRESVYGKY